MNEYADTLVLFPYDWDEIGCDNHAIPRANRAGFDLHRFPANLRLATFDIERFTTALARRAPRTGWGAVTSGHDQFGALAAARLAERMGWPGTPVRAVLASQHKLHARRVLERVAPEANPDRFGLIDMPYNGVVPSGLPYPIFVRPIKAAFSVLAREVRNADELHDHTRFGPLEKRIIQRLVEPFHRLQSTVLPEADNPHRLYYESPLGGRQYNLDGYVHAGQAGTASARPSRESLPGLPRKGSGPGQGVQVAREPPLWSAPSRCRFPQRTPAGLHGSQCTCRVARTGSAAGRPAGTPHRHPRKAGPGFADRRVQSPSRAITRGTVISAALSPP